MKKQHILFLFLILMTGQFYAMHDVSREYMSMEKLEEKFLDKKLQKKLGNFFCNFNGPKKGRVNFFATEAKNFCNYMIGLDLEVKMFLQLGYKCKSLRSASTFTRLNFIKKYGHLSYWKHFITKDCLKENAKANKCLCKENPLWIFSNDEKGFFNKFFDYRNKKYPDDFFKESQESKLSFKEKAIIGFSSLWDSLTGTSRKSSVRLNKKEEIMNRKLKKFVELHKFSLNREKVEKEKNSIIEKAGSCLKTFQISENFENKKRFFDLVVKAQE